MGSIPKGYQLQIHSWENDADHPGVEILNGLSKEDVKFYVDLLSTYFGSHNRPGNKETFGNGMDTDMGEVAAAIQKTLAKHPKVSSDVKRTFDFSDIDEEDEDYEDRISDACREVMDDLLGGSEDYDFRVFDSFEVYYYPEAVSSVTAKFRVKR